MDCLDKTEQLQQNLITLLRHETPLIVLRGPKGVGKSYLAQITAKKACDDAGGGEKNSIFYFVPPEGKNYLLEQMQEITSVAKSDSLIGEKKILILDDFTGLSPALLNSLLKLFEEPPKGLTFVLIAHDSSALLPTIASRAICLNFGILPDAVIEKVLEKEGLLKEKILRSATESALLKMAVELAQGQLFWTRRFLSSEFLDERKHAYQTLCQRALSGNTTEHVRAADIWIALTEIEEKAVNKKECFEEIIRYLSYTLRHMLVLSKSCTPAQYWGYLRLCLHLDAQSEAMSRGESLASTLYTPLVQLRSMLLMSASS